MNKETKTIRPEFKQAGDAGEFEAVIATFGVVDSDGDVVERGAFGDATVPILPSHDRRSVPLGKVFKIEERGDQAVAVGQFNLDVAPARDWHAAIKFDLAHPPSVQEYSWGYWPTSAKPDTIDDQPVRRLFEIDMEEISPVLRGASVGTRTLSAKSAERHETETSNAPWDAVLGLRQAKGDFPIPHHFTTDGKTGAASTRACLLGIAELNLQPERFESRKAVYDHLAGHLQDAGITPDPLPADDALPGLSLTQQVKFARWSVETVLLRLREVSFMRQKRGQGLSEEVKAEALLMAAEFEKMAAASGKLDALVEHIAPDDAVSQAIAAYAVSHAAGVLR